MAVYRGAGVQPRNPLRRAAAAMATDGAAARRRGNQAPPFTVSVGRPRLETEPGTERAAATSHPAYLRIGLVWFTIDFFSHQPRKKSRRYKVLNEIYL